MRNRIFIIRILMAITSCCLLLINAGCGSAVKAPELLEPIVNTQSFRQVERGRVGNSAVWIADVMPEEYCHFSKLATEISEIKVDLGDYVEAGTVLATIDTTALQDEKKKLEAELSLKSQQIEKKKLISVQQITEQQLWQEQYKKTEDTEKQNVCATRIAVLEENYRYDEMLARYQMRMISEDIAEINKSMEEGTIKARHAGYVSYIKDLTEGSSVNSLENIVIVSDYDKLHLELDENIASQLYELIEVRYDEKYILINGKQQPVELYQYSNEQLLTIQSNAAYPNIRFEVEGARSFLKAGDKMPVYFASKMRRAVLKIGNDSLNQDGDQYFVYIKDGEGMERRDIEIGLSDATDVEVVSGLEEGEWVYYSSTSSVPENYDVYSVKKGEFVSGNNRENNNYFNAYTRIYSYTQNTDATVETLSVKQGDEVKQGELLCVLDTGQGSANMQEAAAAMNNLQIDYEKNAASYETQIAELNKQIADLKEAEERAAAEIENPGIEVEQPEAELDDTEEEPATNLDDVGGESETEPEDTEKKSEIEPDTDAEQDTETVKDTSEILECQRNVLIYEKDILYAQYQYERTLLQQDYDKISRTSDGKGKREIYAEQDGVIENLNIYEGKQIVAKEDGNLFQIADVNSHKLMIDTKDSRIGVGNEVVLTAQSDSGKKYTGRVVGNSAIVEKVYLSEENEKIYATTSISANKRNRVYIEMEDEIFFENMTGCDISYANVRIQDCVVLPAVLVQSEVNKEDTATYYFVWKIVDDLLVKQYVKVNENLMTETEICILDGLKDGDLIAKLKVEE